LPEINRARNFPQFYLGLKTGDEKRAEKICTPRVKAGSSFAETEKKAVTFPYIRLLTGSVVQINFAASLVSAITASLPGINQHPYTSTN